tara:strand:- start:252 stop:431 length:180 start_codon:yes stop_codon:yes gene_type:complete
VVVGQGRGGVEVGLRGVEQVEGCCWVSGGVGDVDGRRAGLIYVRWTCGVSGRVDGCQQG